MPDPTILFVCRVVPNALVYQVTQAQVAEACAATQLMASEPRNRAVRQPAKSCPFGLRQQPLNEDNPPAYMRAWRVRNTLAKQIANRVFRHKVDSDHVAIIHTILITEEEARRARQGRVSTFLGHEWMVGSLLTYGRITERFRA